MIDNRIWVYDIETLSNFFSYTARNVDTNEIVQLCIWKESNDLSQLLIHLNRVKGLIGYNNLDFDYPVIHYILNYHNEWEGLTGEEIARLIYSKAQDVIEEEFSSIRSEYVKIPQLDLFKIWHYNNHARMTSLKKLQIALRYDNVQDMPYKHTDEIATKEQATEILDYNLNDVDSTLDFYLRSKPKIDLRRGIYEKYGLNCMNFPDSKIGEDLTLKLYCDEICADEKVVRKKRTKRESFDFSECIPEYVEFDTEEFKGLLEYLKGIKVKELKSSFKHILNFINVDLHLGTGGLHGSIKAGLYESTDEEIIVDVDVGSMYPNIAIQNKLYPKHLGEVFLKVYEDGIVKPRMEAKKKGDKIIANGFKLSANSVNKHSVVPLYKSKDTNNVEKFRKFR